jgi:hypothetical protein
VENFELQVKKLIININSDNLCENSAFTELKNQKKTNYEGVITKLLYEDNPITQMWLAQNSDSLMLTLMTTTLIISKDFVV